MIGHKLIASLIEGRGPCFLRLVVVSPWRNVSSVCSQRNPAWDQFRNSIADYQCRLGGNRVDYNDDSTVHEVPEFIGRVE